MSRSTSWCLICAIEFWNIQTIQAFSIAQEKIEEFIFRILVNCNLQPLRFIEFHACSITRCIIVSMIHATIMYTSWLKRPFFFSHIKNTTKRTKKKQARLVYFFLQFHTASTITTTSTACAWGVGRWGIVGKGKF